MHTYERIYISVPLFKIGNFYAPEVVRTIVWDNIIPKWFQLDLQKLKKNPNLPRKVIDYFDIVLCYDHG